MRILSLREIYAKIYRNRANEGRLPEAQASPRQTGTLPSLPSKGSLTIPRSNGFFFFQLAKRCSHVRKQEEMVQQENAQEEKDG